MNIISDLISAIFQVLVFTLIPFLVYLIKYKKNHGFLNYIGIKKSNKKANIFAIISSLLFAAPPLMLILISEEFKEIMLNPNTITGKFNQMAFGINSTLILFVIAVIKTAFAEEIFFRGFIAKRLISIIGFQKGNILQSLIFGIIHTGIFSMMTQNPFFLAVIFAIPAIGAYVSVVLNEKIASGSILPGWISHGLGNILSYGIVGFLM